MREWKYFREVLVRIDRPKEQWDVEGYVFRHRWGRKKWVRDMKFEMVNVEKVLLDQVIKHLRDAILR